MSSDNIKTMLSELKLNGMLQSYLTQISSRAFDEFCRDEVVEHLAVGEIQYRRDRSQQRLYRTADFKHKAQPEDMIFSPERKIDKAKMTELITGDWIGRNENLLIDGATGTGKTWVGCAIGASAIRRGMSVRYFRTKSLLREMSLAMRMGKSAKLKSALYKPGLIILDDFGLGTIDVEHTEYLLDLLDARTNVNSMMVIGQRATIEWHDYLAEAQMADAIIDRLLQRSHRLSLQGPSMRKSIS